MHIIHRTPQFLFSFPNIHNILTMVMVLYITDTALRLRRSNLEYLLKNEILVATVHIKQTQIAVKLQRQPCNQLSAPQLGMGQLD